MVVRLRLQRLGVRNLPFYRIVAADSRAPRDGKFIEKLGSYNPVPTKDGLKEFQIQGDRVKYWMSVGAQPSERVSFLLAKCGLIPEPPRRMSIESAIPKILRIEEVKKAPKKADAAKADDKKATAKK